MMTRFLKAFLAADDGATAVEYGLIVALIALSLVGVLTTLGSGISSKLTTLANAVDSAGK